MRRMSIVAILMCVLSLTTLAAGPVEIYGSLAFGGLLSGYQKDLPDMVLSPQPDSYSIFVPILGLRYFFIEQAGIESFATIGGSTKAESSLISTPLALYNISLANAGLILRFRIEPGRDGGGFAFLAGGGVNYPLTDIISTDFNTLMWAGGFSFRPVSPDLGWYGKAGLAYYIGRHFFLDFTAYYEYVNAHFDIGQKLDGSYMLFAFGIGVAF
jgi:hypothetical protein